MVDAVNTGYQPAVAYQGGPVSTSPQEPKSGQTQPLQAPAADTQRGDLDLQRDGDDGGQGRKRLDIKV